jgi:cell division protease FtsH
MMSSIDSELRTNRRIFVLVISIVTLLLCGPILFAVFDRFIPSPNASSVEISFSQLVNDMDIGRVHDIRIKGTEIYGTYTDGHTFQADAPDDPTLIQPLYTKGVSITRQPMDLTDLKVGPGLWLAGALVVASLIYRSTRKI